MTTRREFLGFVAAVIAGAMLPRGQEPTGFDALVAECPSRPMTYEDFARGLEIMRANAAPPPEPREQLAAVTVWNAILYSDDDWETWTTVDIDRDNPFGAERINARIEDLASV